MRHFVSPIYVTIALQRAGQLRLDFNQRYEGNSQNFAHLKRGTDVGRLVRIEWLMLKMFGPGEHVAVGDRDITSFMLEKVAHKT